jgi:hypothetical protein
MGGPEQIGDGGGVIGRVGQRPHVGVARIADDEGNPFLRHGLA